jgi:hypothetical protein
VILKINDWEFDIDLEGTREHSSFAASDHCTCAYCENYYRAVKLCYPHLRGFLKRFGLDIDGPVEMYPFEPTLYLAGYRVRGKIIRPGLSPIMVDGVPVTAEPREDWCFMLEVGEMELPWVMHEDPNEVISPANEPEFLERMYRKMWERNIGNPGILS